MDKREPGDLSGSEGIVELKFIPAYVPAKLQRIKAKQEKGDLPLVPMEGTRSCIRVKEKKKKK